MLELNFLRNNAQELKNRLNKRGKSFNSLIDEILEVDSAKRKAQKELDDELAKSNQISQEVGVLMKAGRKEEAEILRGKSSEQKEKIASLKAAYQELEQTQDAIMVQIPNAPQSIVKEGKTPEENEIVKEAGTIPTLSENALAHWDLGKKYSLFDTETGVKLTGAGFPVYFGQGARIQRALTNFFLDEAANAGFLEVIPPFLVNQDSAFGTGQLPDKEAQMYETKEEGFFLIPTAEVPVTNIYRDVILNEDQLPVKLCAHSPCFRREAGSYGKDVRGLNRVHQFEKVEIVSISHPEKSDGMLDFMIHHVEQLLTKLELPYRILRLCGGDMGFASAITYDFEVYSAAQQKWLEVSSVSNFETFQSNRLKLRYKDNTDSKTRLLHTLNGSALALPRIYASLIENHQTPEGKINIPTALTKYTGFRIVD